MVNITERREELLDWSNLVLALILFVAPWVLGFAGDTAAAWNAWVCAVVIALLAGAAIRSFVEWEEWANVALGIWVAVSPWLFGVDGVAAVLWSHLILGALVAVLAACRLWLVHRSPRVTA